mmetsp:Transcript_46815/g.141809  ORF Transcript_46815/g.141809 Transcript_46815/m.141809 type:complete len:400 (+) Transcript_46815:105-1304(+)
MDACSRRNKKCPMLALKLLFSSLLMHRSIAQTMHRSKRESESVPDRKKTSPFRFISELLPIALRHVIPCGREVRRRGTIPPVGGDKRPVLVGVARLLDAFHVRAPGVRPQVIPVRTREDRIAAVCGDPVDVSAPHEGKGRFGPPAVLIELHPQQPRRVPLMHLEIRVRQIREQEEPEQCQGLHRPAQYHPVLVGRPHVHPDQRCRDCNLDGGVDKHLPRPVAHDVVQGEGVSQGCRVGEEGGEDGPKEGREEVREEAVESSPLVEPSTHRINGCTANIMSSVAATNLTIRTASGPSRTSTSAPGNPHSSPPNPYHESLVTLEVNTLYRRSKNGEDTIESGRHRTQKGGRGRRSDVSGAANSTACSSEGEEERRRSCDASSSRRQSAAAARSSSPSSSSK